MRSTALDCASPISGVAACAASTAASQPAPSSVAVGVISSSGASAPVAPVSSPTAGLSWSCGSVRPCGEGGVVTGVVVAAGCLTTVVPLSWAAAVPRERHRAIGNAKNRTAALRLVINPPPLTGAVLEPKEGNR